MRASLHTLNGMVGCNPCSSSNPRLLAGRGGGVRERERERERRRRRRENRDGANTATADNGSLETRQYGTWLALPCLQPNQRYRQNGGKHLLSPPGELMPGLSPFPGHSFSRTPDARCQMPLDGRHLRCSRDSWGILLLATSNNTRITPA